jgi:phenylalanyl-tRNA synthetase beta chain
VLIPDWEGIQRAGATAAPPRLSNPATRDRQILRVTLLASLLDVVARNLKHTNERISFFEMDRTFFWRSEEELPYERRTLAIALSGNRRPRTWADPAPGPHTFYDIKGVVEAVLDALHIQGATVAPYRHPSLHPGRSASLNLGDTQVAYFGELHPEVAARFEIEGWPVQVAEIDLDALFPCASGPAGFSTLPRFPAAYRDIAVVVRRDVPAADVIGVVERAGGDLLEAARIFDVYTGEPLPRDRKSVAVEMVFRGAEGTLTQEDVSAAVDGIVGALRDTVGASLRD